jgi:peptidoglycan/xylan/chitin deacetylase (PgdA/CDA1 family)
MQASLSQLDASYIRIRHFVIILEETELFHGTLLCYLLSELGHDIQSHGVSHKDLTTLSACDLEDEVGQSKQSLLEHDFNSTIF